MLTLNDGRIELWQWDTGRTLAVDADCSQVHFSNKVFGRSIDVDVIDGIATIPDILLQTDNELNVWAFVGTAENGYTKISKTFKVNRRNKPSDYVFTPPEQTTLEQIKERLEYLEQNPVEVPVQSVNGKIGAVELTSEDVGAISQDDLQAATNEALAQAKASGEFDGTDGITPHIGDNGNWFVGSDDTGKPSRGEKGEPGSPGAKGDKGDTGAQGIQGEQGIQGVQGAKGDKGDTGATPNLTIGTVTTLEAGQNATASMGGTAESPVLNLGIPRGAKGEPGQGGGGTYYVELDGDFPNYTLSETTPLADIKAAYNDGKALFCRGSIGTGKVTLPLLSPRVEENTWLFSGTTTSTITILVSAQGVAAANKGIMQTDTIVTTISASSTDSEVPSAKCLYDELQERSLKQATSEVLGGVKADPATESDTQPVRIGNDGKLVTAGGTDISLGLTSAAVGQIIKVKAIDESGKPTAWEAVEMSGDRWELITAIEIPDGTEETNALTISADKNGNAFSLKKARLITYFPKYTGESSIPGYSFTMINGFITGPQAPLCYTSGLPVPNKSQNPEGWLEVDLSMPGYEVERVARFGGAGGPPAELMHWGARRLNGAETITSIGGTNMLIYPGCKFTLYGVRA